MKGTNILVTEDYPKRVRDARNELVKFGRKVCVCQYIKYFISFLQIFIVQVRKTDPDARIQLQWDKLFINNDAFIVCELTGNVVPEESHSSSSRSASPTKTPRSGRRSPWKTPRHLSRAHSTESSLSLASFNNTLNGGVKEDLEEVEKVLHRNINGTSLV